MTAEIFSITYARDCSVGMFMILLTGFAKSFSRRAAPDDDPYIMRWPSFWLSSSSLPWIAVRIRRASSSTVQVAPLTSMSAPLLASTSACFAACTSSHPSFSLKTWLLHWHPRTKHDMRTKAQTSPPSPYFSGSHRRQRSAMQVLIQQTTYIVQNETRLTRSGCESDTPQSALRSSGQAAAFCPVQL